MILCLENHFTITAARHKVMLSTPYCGSLLLINYSACLACGSFSSIHHVSSICCTARQTDDVQNRSLAAVKHILQGVFHGIAFFRS